MRARAHIEDHRADEAPGHFDRVAHKRGTLSVGRIAIGRHHNAGPLSQCALRHRPEVLQIALRIRPGGCHRKRGALGFSN